MKYFKFKKIREERTLARSVLDDLKTSYIKTYKYRPITFHFKIAYCGAYGTERHHYLKRMAADLFMKYTFDKIHKKQ